MASASDGGGPQRSLKCLQRDTQVHRGKEAERWNSRPGPGTHQGVLEHVGHPTPHYFLERMYSLNSSPPERPSLPAMPGHASYSVTSTTSTNLILILESVLKHILQKFHGHSVSRSWLLPIMLSQPLQHLFFWRHILCSQDCS